jgi:ABC-2 type transport system ATP-binding protein
MNMIEVDCLSKTFKVAKRPETRKQKLNWLFRREYEIVNALKNISFSVAEGGIVGFIGPNGAGKSTLTKILCGILTPSCGRAITAGLIPYKKRQENSKHIGVVFGQRSQLWWDLPVIDSFELLKHVYKIDNKKYQDNISFYSNVMELGEFINTPVRQLSLGQRVRADIVASLLHDPMILYLDEPTIGLDLNSRGNLREVIREINKQRGVTIFLSSHDLFDIEEVCKSLLVIDRGTIIYSGGIEETKEKYGSRYAITVDLAAPVDNFVIPNTILVEKTKNKYKIEYDHRFYSTSRILEQIIAKYSLVDLVVEEPSIESIVRNIYDNKNVPSSNE